jgi:hypothetical protein
MTRILQGRTGIKLLLIPLCLLAAASMACAGPVEELNAFALNTFQLLSARKYDRLEQSFRPYLDAYARKTSTVDDLYLHFDVFSGMSEVDSELDGWIKAYPESYSARLARGIYFVNEAWRRRGDQMGDRTSLAQLEGFHKYLEDSRRELQASLTLYSRPTESYRYLIRVAKGLGNGKVRLLLDKALKLDPAALEPRLEYLDAVRPRWGGSEEQMAALLKEGMQSPMSARDKTSLQGRYYLFMAQDARLQKNYRAGSDYFYQGYKATGEENALLFSAEIAIDAEDPKLALLRLDELLKTFPKSSNGYDYRAKVYEYKFKDLEQAIPDYIKAADLGSSWSQNHIGWMYMQGIKLPVDYKKARYYLEMAARQGNKTSQGNLLILNQLEREN